MGDSAGGYSSLIMKLRTLKTKSYPPKGTILISPWLSVNGPGNVPEFKGKDTDYMDPLTVEAFRHYVRTGGGEIEGIDSIIKECIELGGMEETLILSGGEKLSRSERDDVRT